MRAIIYPYNLSVSQIMRKRNLLNQLDIQDYVTPRGYLEEGKDLSCIDEDSFTGINAKNDFMKSLEMVDTVIWAEYLHYLRLDCKNSFKNTIFKNIENAINEGKDIFCLERLSNDEKEYFNKIAMRKKIKFTYFNAEIDNNQVIAQNNAIDIPVIGVMGLNDNCMKFNSQLILRESLQKHGYKVSQIGSKHYSELFGFHSFPSFIFDYNISIIEKIYAFRKFILKIIQEEVPNVMIIGIPRGILNTSDTIIDNFGIIAYLVTCSVKFDYSILNIPCFSINNDFLQEIELLMKYKYGVPLNAIIQSNIVVDLMDEGRLNYNCYKVLSSSEAKRMYEDNLNLCKPVFSVLDHECGEKLIRSIENTFAKRVFAI